MWSAILASATPMKTDGNGQRRTTWCAPPPVPVLDAICSQVMVVAIRMKISKRFCGEKNKQASEMKRAGSIQL